MKCEILCSVCAEKMRKLHKGKSYPGENVTLLKGLAKFDYICDFCGNDIAFNSECYAETIWKDGKRGMWEPDYINCEPDERLEVLV